MRPLGDYEQFVAWTGRPREWGPEDRWKAWFGGNVLDGLVGLIDEHMEAVRNGSQHGQPQAAAIGCVPWLSSGPVLDRLVLLPACCIVIDKGATSTAVHRLAAADNGLPNVLPELVDLAPAVEGTPLVVGPTDGMPEHLLGPLRIAGWRVQRGGQAPLLHAKLLVLGALQWGEGEFGEEIRFFNARLVWWGSANWTTASAQHLEAGFWSDDPSLLNHARDFVASVVAFSEPWGSPTVGPEPNLARVEFDDEAFADYMAEWG